MREGFLVVVGGGAEAPGSWDDTFSDGEFVLAIRGTRAGFARGEAALALFIGELDNAAEVGRLLGVDQESLTNPARVIMRAWQRWGDAALDRLVGPFSGAYLDLQARQLTVFRDITAGAPVYTTQVGHSFVAGSDLSSIATWGGRRIAPSEVFVASYLQNNSVGGTCTAFDGVYSLEAGAVATPARADGWKQHVVADWHIKQVRHRRLDAYVDDFAEHLDQAVLRRVAGHNLAAVSLSGGLDSTNVLASGALVAPNVAWVAYSIPFYSEKGDERDLQAIVAAHCNARLEWVSVDGRGPTGMSTGALFGGSPAPPWGGNWFFGDALAEAALRDQVPIMFDGEDADSLLSGSRGYLSDLLARGRWLAWRREAQRVGATSGATMSALLKGSVVPLLPPPISRRLGAAGPVAKISPLIAPELAARTNLADRLHAQPWVRVWAPGRRFAAQQRVAGGSERVGEVVTEIGNPFRRAGVIDAHPFFDRELMRFCMGLPWQAVHNGTTPKILLRELSKRRLPTAFCDQVRKANLGEYYDRAVLELERDCVEAGLALAAQRPEWVSQAELANLRLRLDRGIDSWMPSRVAMLMLWVDELERGVASVRQGAAF